MNYDEKEIIKKLKLLGSSLFSRKMPYAIFGAYKEDNKILFTNIDIESVLIYEPSVEYYIHLVTIKDEKFLKDLFKIYPVLKEATCVLHISKFMTVINKLKNDIISTKFKINGSSMILTGKEDIAVECGDITSETVCNIYRSLFDEANKNFSDGYVKLLTADDFTEATIYPRVYDDKLESLNAIKRFVTIAILGKNLVNVIELTKKTKEIVPVKLLTCKDTKTIQTRYEYDCSFLNVLSVWPAMRWFQSTKS